MDKKIKIDSRQVVSLGHRLKELEPYITKLIKNKETNRINPTDESELEGNELDIKSELEGNAVDDSKYSDDELEHLLQGLQEICAVEGRDSHTISTLNEISEQIKYNHLTAALPKINKLISIVMPFDYKEFFKLYQATVDTAGRLKGKVCWVLLGPTGAGKSTSINLFCGSTFKKGIGGGVVVDEKAKSLRDKDIKVGSNVTESQTRYIDAVDFSLKPFEDNIDFGNNEPKRILWVDSPGFEDTAGPEVNVSNGIGTIRALKKAKMVKIIITFKEAHLDSRFQAIRSIADNMSKAVDNLEQLLNDRFGSPIAAFLTKSTHGVEGAKAVFNKAYEEREEKGDSSDENAILKALIYKLGKKGPLYDIKIDVNDRNENEKTSLSIVKSLVEDVGYIKRPNEAFNEFISVSSKGKLQEQVQNNLNTIQNILDHDEYFNNPKYLTYIIDILNDLEELKSIIRNAGGNVIESKLNECISMFKTKWNNKVAMGGNILRDINIKQCSINSLQKKFKKFDEIKHVMRINRRAIKSSKYYKELNDINGLNDGLHECFNEVFDIIMGYLKSIKNQLKVYDSDIETAAENKSDDDIKSPKLSDSESELMDNDYENDKNISQCVKKCCLIYEKYKSDKANRHIRKSFKKFEHLVEEVIVSIKRKVLIFMKKPQERDGVSTLMFMFSNLAKLNNILMIMDKYHNNINNINNIKHKPLLHVQDIIPDISRQTSGYEEEDYDDDEKEVNKSSKVENIMQTLTEKLKENIAKAIKKNCDRYSLYVLDVNNDSIQDNTQNKYVDVTVIVKSKVNFDMASRESKLISFCGWLTELYDSLCNKNNPGLDEIITVKKLQDWIKDVHSKWVKWLCAACLVELKECNNLLISNKGAALWNDVDKLLIECKSLRKVDFVQNETSQEFFKTTTEFDSHKSELANKAAELVEELNKGKNVDFGKIIKIADQLNNAGCSKESNEMKQIYNKLKHYVNNLKLQTESIVLTIEMPDDLILIQNTMKELDTLQTFGQFMDNIKDVNECYKVLNKQVIDVVKGIELKYDISKHSTANTKILNEKLKIYKKMKNKIDKNVLNDVIMKCELKSLTQLIKSNERDMNELKSRNEDIDKIMKQKCGTVMVEKAKYEKDQKKGKKIMMFGEDDDLEEWLNENNYKNLREIGGKLEECNTKLKTICTEEEKENVDNKNKIKKLNHINIEINKLLESENDLRKLQPADKVIEYRMDNGFLDESIQKLKKELGKGQNYLFPQKLSLYDAYNALNFLNQCKVIKWNLKNKIEEKESDILTIQYVHEINTKVSKYLNVYGDFLEQNLNDLIGNLAVKDGLDCDLNDPKYRDKIDDVISKLGDCLREFREISNFDIQIKMQMEDDVGGNTRKQLRIVASLFTNRDIQMGVDNYIGSIISDHKQNILMKFAQWRVRSSEKLPLLRFICLSMSALDRFVSSSKRDGQDSYYRISAQIDGEITKSCDDNTKLIMPSFENAAWNRLDDILKKLKKAADADKDGIGQKNYRDAVMQLFGLLHKLMNETKNKLMIEINKDNEINEQTIFILKEGLDKVKNLKEIITPHLHDQSGIDKVENEWKALSSLLSNRVKGLEKAAIQSAKNRDFKQCQKRLDNIKRLTDYDTGFYITHEVKTEEKDKDASEEKKSVLQQIDEELDKVLEQVKEASESLINLKAFNPYQRLRLSNLHHQLAGSNDQKFRDLWNNIQEEIVTTMQNILGRIEELNNQMQMQSEFVSEFNSEKVMTYSQQQQYFGKIEMSLSLFPTELKGIISIMLKKTKDLAIGSKEVRGEGFQQYLDQNTWDQVARNLKDFENNDQRFFHKQRQQVIKKMTDVFTKFNGHMKTEKGFNDMIESLESYKQIGLNFTNIFGNKPLIIIGHIQTTLKQMYKRITNRFTDICRDINSSLTGQKEYKYLKKEFYKIIKLLQYKDKLPESMAQKMTEESTKLYTPIRKLINKLNADKKKGLDKDSHDIDKLINALDVLQELTEAQFHSNVRRLMPLIDVDEKEDVAKLDKDIRNIQYDVTVKQTKDMLTEFKENISNDGLKIETIQQSQAKREAILKNVSNKCKSLIKSSNICKKHFEMEQKDFDENFIKPCTKRMKKDIQRMQKDTFDAFKRPRLQIPELKRANANLEAFYAIKNVFEKEINNEKLCEDIKIGEAIEVCEDTAATKIEELTREIQVTKSIKEENMDAYMQQCAQNLMNLEYLNQHINFKTSINENAVVSMSQPPNALKKQAEEAIARSMRFLTDNKQTKPRINNLYNHLLDKDANYGYVFAQQHSAFAAAFAEMMNQAFRELPIGDIIQNLKQTEKEFDEKKLMLNGRINIDYDGIKEKFDEIVRIYEDLITTNLRSTASFEDLKRDKIPKIASEARVIARRAVNSKNTLLTSVGSLVTGAFSWALGSNSHSKKKNPRDCCWTSDMRGAVPELIAHILAVWTLSSSSCYYDNKSQKTLMKARNAQIVAICCVLCLDIQDAQYKKLINNLVEVGTGEGKSLIIGVTATVLALLDFDVYCACYSELLSSRDKSSFNDLFLQFNVARNIEYHTFNKILEKMINDGGDVRDMAKNIVLSKVSGDEKKSDVQKFNKRQKILFIDEVDKFFSTDFFGKQYTPSCVIPSKEMKDLIIFVWNEYISNESNGMAITEPKIRGSKEYNALLAAFNSEWHALLKESMKDIIDGIRTFKDDLYKIDKNGKDICYKFSDSYSSKVFYGYRTLFTYLYELDRGNITDTEYVHKKLTWFLKCGSFSYSEIPNDFFAILGVTGTLKSLSPKEHEVIQNSYGIKKYIVMPSLFDKAGKLDYAINRDISIINPLKANFYNELHAIIKTYENIDSDSDEIKRPVIVFFKDERSLNDFYKNDKDEFDVCKEWRLNDRIQLLTPDLTDIEKKTGILNATKPNQITFATEEYGRGIDFKVFDKKLKTKGMHVELTYWPETLAEEIQIKGRTARQGQRGSVHIILNEATIIDQCNITTEDIEKHRNDGDLYAYLNEIRNKVFEKSYDEASNYVKELKPIHKESEKLAMSLRTKNIQVAKKLLLHFNKGANIQSAAKLSIVIDATGSMSSCLTQCKTVIQKTIPELVQFLKNNNLDTDQFEIQVVAYRNYNADTSSILESCAFTSSESTLTTFIHSLSADYGWGPEAVEVAFAHLNKQTKKPNVVMLMADAPAQSKQEMLNKRQRRGEDYWMSAGGIFRNKLDWSEELNKFTNENNDASVFCFYLTNRAKDNFNQIASIAGGNSRSIELDINKERESVALLQSALSETILFKMNNGNMELVNKFREQTKNKNMPTFL